jgi:FKBP-type peptidyl-prolyl cis-trans isomerase
MLIKVLPLLLILGMALPALADPALENMRKEATFLRDNREKEGVRETESGLQYEVLKEGTGAKPGRSSRVKVHYQGELLNGKIFDSSLKRGQPAVFGVTQVISGWTEALQMMKEGARWKLYIPSKLAYGARGAGRTIGPNELLIFEVELIEILN